MPDPWTTLAGAVAAITAVGALGTAAFGLVDASKAFRGGASNFGFDHVLKCLAPFQDALTHANSDWRDTIRANWINGVPKDDQKMVAKSLIRLGLSSTNAEKMAEAGHVDPQALKGVLSKIETGATLTTQDAQVLGRFNGAIDAAMDAGFERGDQQYRNACRVAAGLVSVVLAVWAGYLVSNNGLIPGQASTSFGAFLASKLFWPSVLAGLVAVPIAPVAKDIASSLQTAGAAVKAIGG